jgi:hypothetical protein
MSLRICCLIRFCAMQSVSELHLVFFCVKGRSMRARNRHVPNGEVDGPSLAFHLVRFVPLGLCFLPTATI